MKNQGKILISLILAVVLLTAVILSPIIPGITSVFNAEPLPTEEIKQTNNDKDNHRESLVENYGIVYVPTGYQTGTFDISIDSSEGVQLTYDEDAIKISGTAQYDIFTFSETKDITIYASFSDGWSYSENYTQFFESNLDRTEIKKLSNGDMEFTFHAIEGERVAYSDISLIGIYATPDELPKLTINVDMPFSDVTKDEWVTAKFTLTNGTMDFGSNEFNGIGEVKGRGNSSWKRPKKGYSIKFDEAVSLLGIPETKKYAIIANYDDDSLIRNYITYKVSLMLNGLDYSPKCELVEVWLNGNYNGIYLLVERVDVEDTKLDLNNPADGVELSGDYLIEKDIDGKIDFNEDPWFNSPYWANQSRDYFVMQYPETQDPILQTRMLNYLEDYITDVHNAIMGISDESYTQYVDMDSWIDFIIMQEISKNIDGNLKTSCYLYKLRDDDKLYMATLWDFDLAYGNADWDNADHDHNDFEDCPSGTGVEDYMTINSSCPWFEHLYEGNEEFRNALMLRYAQYRDTIIPEMQRLINKQAAYLEKAAVRNDELWNTNFADGISRLANWLVGRVNWLDSKWLDNTIPVNAETAINASNNGLKFDNTYESYPFIGVVDGNRLSGMSNIAGMDNFESGIRLTLEMLEGETISFDYKVSSEKDYDKFFFKVNDVTELADSGETEWKAFTFTAPESGTYNFRWFYKKDYSGAVGKDCVWLDNICYSGAPTEYLHGDVNLDGILTLDDVIGIIRYNKNLGMLLDRSIELADFDGNGRVDTNDVSLLIDHILLPSTTICDD